ncbi:MAG: hypothetical protein JW938_00220 [Candidatus Omnitrophica bacterium]|nr:hypothetical protein [Candidatus Omnitrophota bacterium]
MKNKTHTQQWKTITSIITLVMFVCAQSTFAAAPKVYTVKLPKEACDVKERWKGKSNKTVIHIQDAHNNVDAQMNIARIIEGLVTDNDIEVVGVEGAASKIDLSDLRSFPSESAKETVTNWYIEDGILSGAEKGLITSKKEFQLIGVEDKELFRKNFRAFYGTQLKREDIISQIEEIENILNDLKTPIYGMDLMTFDNIVTLWDKGQSDLVHFLQELDQFVINNDIDILNYIHYASFREVLMLKMKVLETTLTAERDTINGLIEGALGDENNQAANDVREPFAKAKTDFTAENITEREFIEYQKYFAEKLGIDFNTFPQLNAQLKYLQAFSRLDMNALMSDVKLLTHDVRLKLARSEDERELITHARHIRMLKDLSALTAVNAEVAYFKDNMDSFRYNAFVGFVNEKASKYQVDVRLEPDGTDIDKMLMYIRHFYKGAELRNTVLVDNLLKQMDYHGDREAALVSGGYHTEGIVEELQKRGISYLVVTPKIDDPNVNAAYAQKMMGQIVPLSPQLVGNITLLTTWKDSLAPGEFQKLMEAIKGFMGTSVVKHIVSDLSDRPREEQEDAVDELVSTIYETASADDGQRDIARELIMQLILDPSLAGLKNLQPYLKNIDMPQFIARITEYSVTGQDLTDTFKNNLANSINVKSLIGTAVEEDMPAQKDMYRRIAGTMLFDGITGELGGRKAFYRLTEEIRTPSTQVHIFIDEGLDIENDSAMSKMLDSFRGIEAIIVDAKATPEKIDRLNLTETQLQHSFIIAKEPGDDEVSKYAEKPIIRFELNPKNQNHRAVFYSMLMVLLKYAMADNKGDVLAQIESFVVKTDTLINIKPEIIEKIEDTRKQAMSRTSA